MRALRSSYDMKKVQELEDDLKKLMDELVVRAESLRTRVGEGVGEWGPEGWVGCGV
jgi:hypothetical protein